MKINRYEDLNLQELDVMKEIGSIGTGHAATALSKLLQREVRITIPKVQILDFDGAVKRNHRCNACADERRSRWTDAVSL